MRLIARKLLTIFTFSAVFITACMKEELADKILSIKELLVQRSKKVYH